MSVRRQLSQFHKKWIFMEKKWTNGQHWNRQKTSNRIFVFLFLLINKTAGHNQDIYRPLTLLNIPFRTMKAFSRKKYYLQQILIFFPKLKFFWFLHKTFISGEKRHFYAISFDTHSTANLPPLLSFLKKFKLFFKKTPKFVRFEKS